MCSLCFEHAHRQESASKLAISLLEFQLGRWLALGAIFVQMPNQKGLKRSVCRRRMKRRKYIREVVACVREYDIATWVLDSILH